jgi:lysophospholipase L1-like esterase
MSIFDFVGSDLWNQEVSMFEEMVKYIKPDPIVLLGDSLIQEFRMNEFLPGYYFINRGIDKETTRGLFKRLKCSVYDLNPARLFILIGSNDLTVISNEKIISNYREILLGIISHCPECEIVVISILPTKGLIDRLNKRILNLNIELEKLSSDFVLKFLNIHPLFCDEGNELKVEFSDDGLHLNQKGYNLFAKNIRSCL